MPESRNSQHLKRGGICWLSVPCWSCCWVDVLGSLLLVRVGSDTPRTQDKRTLVLLGFDDDKDVHDQIVIPRSNSLDWESVFRLDWRRTWRLSRGHGHIERSAVVSSPWAESSSRSRENLPGCLPNLIPTSIYSLATLTSLISSSPAGRLGYNPKSSLSVVQAYTFIVVRFHST